MPTETTSSQSAIHSALDTFRTDRDADVAVVMCCEFTANKTGSGVGARPIRTTAAPDTASLTSKAVRRTSCLDTDGAANRGPGGLETNLPHFVSLAQSLSSCLRAR